MNDIQMITFRMKCNVIECQGCIFQKLKEAIIDMKEAKCKFLKHEIHYLRHFISDQGSNSYQRNLKACNIQNI